MSVTPLLLIHSRTSALINLFYTVLCFFQGKAAVQGPPRRIPQLFNGLFPLLGKRIGGFCNKRSLSRDGIDDPIAFQKLVGLLHRVGIYPQLLGQRTYRGDLLIFCKCAERGHPRYVLIQLLINREPAPIVQRKQHIVHRPFCIMCINTV